MWNGEKEWFVLKVLFVTISYDYFYENFTYSDCIIIETKIELIFNNKTYNNRVDE
jgi:hypothetical protein